MTDAKKCPPGLVTRPRTAVALIAATVLISGAISTEASARSKRHHHHQGHHHHHRHHAQNDWRNANASLASPSGGRSFSGMASFYGNESGSRTASGQRFNASAMTAAHRSLPFGTKLRVTHGGRSVVVTINDRGPFIRGRVLDLSSGAARAIGLTSRGVGRVVAEVM
ncbi:septal ring lytic transglycosylase RlpA family protein [Rhodopseudomonas palustris]|uniref:Endolytic peptidoglycan transglycosylase RlpA n=1 Tax=Rhodopseudomonas palustris TaxID=1076 RepID=A0A418VDI9_RHOPL|nr:septal ring lytic transglycosylase RlpA family protein [Rhodopseudomonas palustris]RJF74192.1 septal ring lytic transglycosylase RlpA family protein [Rhodopseudomonas palustris]